jgi:hypothetical protein
VLLDVCEFGDVEAVQVLVDNVRSERGPKDLTLRGGPLDSLEKLGEFMNALRGNTYLERRDLGSLGVITDSSVQLLVAPLPESRGLTHLGPTYCNVDDRWRVL